MELATSMCRKINTWAITTFIAFITMFIGVIHPLQCLPRKCFNCFIRKKSAANMMLCMPWLHRRKWHSHSLMAKGWRRVRTENTHKHNSKTLNMCGNWIAFAQLHRLVHIHNSSTSTRYTRVSWVHQLLILLVHGQSQPTTWLIYATTILAYCQTSNSTSLQLLLVLRPCLYI